MFFELRLIRSSMISICPIIDEVHFEPLNETVAAWLFHCEVTLSLFKTNKHLGNYVRKWIY